MNIIKSFMIVIVSLGLLTGCREQFSWHQKLTVTLDTPEGEVSGSSVTEVVVVSLPKTLPDAGVVDASLRGEAVAVEVTPGKYLFVLLKGGLGWAQDAYDKNQVGSVFEENMRFIEAQVGGPAVAIRSDQLPLMVTFDNLSDSTTVQKVDPANLAATFGTGVKLKSVMLAITDEPVSQGRVASLLSWIADYKAQHWRLNGSRCTACPISSDDLSDLIDPADFAIWDK